MGYRLREGVSFCLASGRMVLFDVPNCRYSALPDALDAAFQGLVAGAEPSAAETLELQTLVASGLLLASDSQDTCLPQPNALPIGRSLIEGVRPPAKIWPVINATVAQVETEIRLKRQDLASIFASLQRRQLSARRPSREPGIDLNQVCSAFYWSQRLIASGTKCLRRSIALASYLGNRGVACNLVIGVRMRPFAAHAWVQHADLVLNETVDEARRYTTILVV